MFNATNSKKQGDIGLGAAIGWFTAQGYTVCIPLTDSQDYDLVVDKGDGLKKVQVRTSTQLKESGNYVVNLRVMGGNQSWNGVVKRLDPAKVDLMFVLLETGDKYLIPTSEVTNTNQLTLGDSWNRCKL